MPRAFPAPFILLIDAVMIASRRRSHCRQFAMYAQLEKMNERQLPGLSLDFPRGSCQGSAGRRARALLRVQRSDHDSRTDGSDHSYRWNRAISDADSFDRATPTTEPPAAPYGPSAPAARPAPPRPPATPPGASPAIGDGGARRPLNPFLSKDPDQRAKRLARALVSDIVTYHPAKHAEGLRDGTLKQLFREEIKKSFEEYMAQVGQPRAEGTTYFQTALNEVLGAGKKIF